MSPVVDDALDEPDGLADVLAFVLDFALAEDDGLFAGVDEDLVAAVDTWLRVGAELEQFGLAVGWTLFLADPLELGLAPALALGDVVGLVGTEPPGLALPSSEPPSTPSRRLPPNRTLDAPAPDPSR